MAQPTSPLSGPQYTHLLRTDSRKIVDSLTVDMPKSEIVVLLERFRFLTLERLADNAALSEMSILGQITQIRSRCEGKKCDDIIEEIETLFHKVINGKVAPQKMLSQAEKKQGAKATDKWDTSEETKEKSPKRVSRKEKDQRLFNEKLKYLESYELKLKKIAGYELKNNGNRGKFKKCLTDYVIASYYLADKITHLENTPSPVIEGMIDTLIKRNDSMKERIFSITNENALPTAGIDSLINETFSQIVDIYTEAKKAVHEKGNAEIVETQPTVARVVNTPETAASLEEDPTTAPMKKTRRSKKSWAVQKTQKTATNMALSDWDERFVVLHDEIEALNAEILTASTPELVASREEKSRQILEIIATWKGVSKMEKLIRSKLSTKKSELSRKLQERIKYYQSFLASNIVPFQSVASKSDTEEKIWLTNLEAKMKLADIERRFRDEKKVIAHLKIAYRKEKSGLQYGATNDHKRDVFQNIALTLSLALEKTIGILDEKRDFLIEFPKLQGSWDIFAQISALRRELEEEMNTIVREGAEKIEQVLAKLG